MKEIMSIWMPEFIRGVNESTKILLIEANRLNELAERLESINRERLRNGR
jgi:hypothetical protein